jgi:alpha-D-xyloside xylohydrolase
MLIYADADAGMCCPLFRQHGDRATEIWLYGPTAEAAITKIIALRYTLIDYFSAQMALSSAKGTPLNRPLWFDFPHDPMAWDSSTANQFMVGGKYMVAPVLEPGVTTWKAYLPSAARVYAPYDVPPAGTASNATQWRHFFSGEIYAGGHTVEVEAPLGEFPFFELLG